MNTMHGFCKLRAAWSGRLRSLLRDRFEARLAALGGALALVVGLGLWQQRSSLLVVVLGVALSYAALTILSAHRRELRLSASLGRWPLILAHAGWGVAGATDDGLALVQTNPAFARMHGYSVDELTGQSIEIVFALDSRKAFVDALALTRQVGRHRFESLHRHRDGHFFRVAVDMAMVGGEVVYRFVDLQEVNEMGDARRAAQIAKEFFEKTFDATPVGMFVADDDGRYLRVNRAMCEFTGYSESELLAMSYSDITHPEDVGLQKTWALNGATGSRYQSFHTEKRYLHQNGDEVWAQLTMLRASDGAGGVLYWAGQVLDIDRLKRAELALRLSEQRFRGVFENANTGMVVADPSGRVVHFNEAFSVMLGHDAEVLKQMHFAEFFVPAERSAENPLSDEILKTPGDKYRIERRWTACDGRSVWVDLYISTIRDESGAVVNFIAVVGDITERKKSALALGESKRKLRALAAYQEGLLEQERKHIAGEVHDEMGQLMTALKMDLSLMRLRFGENLQLLAMIDEMRSLVDRTINVVRQVASNLRPAVLDHGLAPAIEWLAADFSKRGTIRCRLDGGGNFALPELQSTAVFRVVQESLTNVTRHSLAREVVISMQCSGQQRQIVVRDDGIGFDTVAVGKGQGFGLFGMRERLLALGGRLRIVSAPGQGTTVTIKLPLVNGDPS
ncbi:MAG: Multi-sensor Signal Transduction Histidine Kinase [Proteobacteria bacterium]|nr:Multi-sensor Signal Transduction Histidine Kinase [Pseudomonadota bacterium]